MLKEVNGKVAIQIECHKLSVQNRTLTLTNTCAICGCGEEK